ncbi:hypothetical protein ES705_23014 [subsurface metagenome]
MFISIKILPLQLVSWMDKLKGKWVSVSIPRSFSRRIKAILGFVADESIAERMRSDVSDSEIHEDKPSFISVEGSGCTCETDAPIPVIC